MQDSGEQVRIKGQVSRPFAPRASDRTIEVREQVDCKPGKVIARGKPRRDGRFTIDVPRSTAGAVYRLHTRVRNAAGGARLANTYSLPRVVEP